MKEEVCLEVELLNQACLDLVAQIERLGKENARLKKRIMGEMENLENPDDRITTR